MPLPIDRRRGHSHAAAQDATECGATPGGRHIIPRPHSTAAQRVLPPGCAVARSDSKVGCSDGGLAYTEIPSVLDCKGSAPVIPAVKGTCGVCVSGSHSAGSPVHVLSTIVPADGAERQRARGVTSHPKDPAAKIQPHSSKRPEWHACDKRRDSPPRWVNSLSSGKPSDLTSAVMFPRYI